MIRLTPLILGAWLIQSGPPATQAVKPLPELGVFLQGIRRHLHSDRIIQSQYTFLERLTVHELDAGNKVKKTEGRVFEVYPSPEEDWTYRKLIEKNGKPLSSAELEKQEQAWKKKYGERVRRLEREGTDEKRRRLAKEAEERRKEDEVLDELFRLYSITMTGREQQEGHSVIALTFEPRPGFQAKSREAKIMSKVRGKAWFGEEDQELTRIEAELGDNLSIGLGMIARLNRGTHMVFQRRRVNDEVWLPAEAHFMGTGRILLFKGFRIDVETTFSEYKKFSVETSVSYGTPKDP